MKKEESRGFDVFFVFGREEKCAENIQVESKTQEILLFFWLRVPGAFYSPGTIFEAATLVGTPPSKSLGHVDLDTPGKILTSCF